MTVAVPSRARRHPMTVVTRARELVASGWNAAETARRLEREGVTVDERSVRRWTDRRVLATMERAERERSVRNAEARGRGPIGAKNASPAYKLARMRTLRDLRLNCAQIARLMGHDFGDEMDERKVAYALEHGRYPRSLR